MFDVYSRIGASLTKDLFFGERKPEEDGVKPTDDDETSALSDDGINGDDPEERQYNAEGTKEEKDRNPKPARDVPEQIRTTEHRFMVTLDVATAPVTLHVT